MEHADRIARIRALLARQLRVRGDSIAEIAERAGRKVPRRARADVAAMAEIEALAANPKTARRINTRDLARTEARLMRRLGRLDPAAERRGEILDRVAMVAFVLVSVGLAVFFYMISQGAFDR